MSDYYLNFDGPNDAAAPTLKVPNSPVFNIINQIGDKNGNFSVSTWIKFKDLSASMTIFEKGHRPGDVAEFYALDYSANFKRFFFFIVSTGNETYSSDVVNLETDVWYHLVFIYQDYQIGDDATTFRMKMYLNGILIGTENDLTVFTNVNNSRDLLIGSSYDSTFLFYVQRLQGDIDDFRYYTKTLLTEEQISDIYNGGIGSKVNESEFETVTSNGWYSNMDNYPDTSAIGRLLIDGVWSDYNTDTNINGTTTSWFQGGFPIVPANNSIVNIGGMPIGVATELPNDSNNFSTPYILTTSYVDTSMTVDPPNYPTYLNLGGLPLSTSLYYDPDISDTDEIGYFYALDVIENFEAVDTDESENEVIAYTTSFSGNRLQVSKINNRYYLNIIRSGIVSSPINKIVWKGVAMSVGSNNELVLNRDINNWTMDNIDTDPNTGALDIKPVTVGGVPLSAGRIGYKYYLIVHPVANP